MLMRVIVYYMLPLEPLALRINCADRITRRELSSSGPRNNWKRPSDSRVKGICHCFHSFIFLFSLLRISSNGKIAD